MSQFSGKCDLYDTLIDIYGFENSKNSKIYVGDSKIPLVINSQKDLIPYYPNLICTGAFNNITGEHVLHITKESYVDIEEKERLDMYLKSVLKIYNRCKRKKEVFDFEKATEQVSYYANKDIIKEIAYRVSINGKKANTDGIHLKSSDYYRQKLVDEMIKNGLDPKDFGYEDFV